MQLFFGAFFIMNNMIIVFIASLFLSGIINFYWSFPQNKSDLKRNLSLPIFFFSCSELRIQKRVLNSIYIKIHPAIVGGISAVCCCTLLIWINNDTQFCMFLIFFISDWNFYAQQELWPVIQLGFGVCRHYIQAIEENLFCPKYVKSGRISPYKKIAKQHTF